MNKGTLIRKFALIRDMRSFIPAMLKSLTVSTLAISLLSGCITVPEQVQLTHNGKAATICKADVSTSVDSTPLDTSGFSLTSWNIYKSKLIGWDKDLDNLHQQSDLLLLQEAHLKPGFMDWLDKNSLDWAMAHAFTLSGSWSGVLTIGKVPQLSPCAQRIHEPYLHLPKTVLISYFPLQGHTESLMVANIHGVNFTLGSNDLSAQLQAIQEVMNQHSGPIILAGDFNTWNNRRLNTVNKLAARHSLHPVNFTIKQPVGHFGHQLDHIYYRGLIPLHSYVTELKSSDHYPLTVTFSLDTDT